MVVSLLRYESILQVPLYLRSDLSGYQPSADNTPEIPVSPTPQEASVPSAEHLLFLPASCPLKTHTEACAVWHN